MVLYDGGDSLGPPLEQKLARLRGDREAHSRKQIWTKDAHGGPYRKVGAGSEAVGASVQAGWATRWPARPSPCAACIHSDRLPCPARCSLRLA